MKPDDETPADEKLAQILRAAAVETDSDKLLALYRKIAALDQKTLNQENDTPSRRGSSSSR